jgi:4-hydroxy-2-oxovalerate aldolase
MFVNAKNASSENLEPLAQRGLKFLRVGNNAGDWEKSLAGVKLVKKLGLTCYYSLMKCYVSTPAELTLEAQALEEAGVDVITIMDSAGMMKPRDVSEYISSLVASLSIPVGFHGHNNLGLSAANAMAAVHAGASVLDGCLMGLARSAGNMPTEMAVALLRQENIACGVEFFTLLHFIDDELAPALAKQNYKAPVSPLDLVYGYAGCHSSFAKTFKAAAAKYHVDLYRLIIDVSAVDKKAPSQELIEKVAGNIAGKAIYR